MAGLQASCSVNDLGESRFSCAEDLRVPRAPPSLRLLRGALRRVSYLGDWKLLSVCPSLSHKQGSWSRAQRGFFMHFGKE